MTGLSDSQRDAARRSAAEQVTRWETALADLLAALWERQEGVVLARLQGTKARKGTRHWTDSVPRADGIRPELKALDPGYILDPVRWVMEAANTVRALVGRMVSDVFTRMLDRLGVPPPDDGGPPVPDPILTAHTDLWVERVVDGVRTAADEVQETIRAADAAGTRMPDIASEVRELFTHRRPTWTQRITTTCVVGAINAVSFDAARAAGCTSKQWLSTDDRRTRDTHIVADGQIVGILDRFRLGGYDNEPASTLLFPGDPTGLPQEVINCLTGSSLVSWSGQEVLGTTRRRYRGPLVQLSTARGHVLAVTPNHPVLTPAGYVPAGQLRPGQQVIASDGPGRSQPQVADRPARIEEFHASLREAGMPQRVMGRGVDFHGDGAEGEEVEVVRPDCDLALERNVERVGAFEQFPLVWMGSGAGALPGAGCTQAAGADDVLVLNRDGATAGGVGGSGEGAPLGGGEASQAQPVGLATTANGQAEFDEPSDDERPADAETVAHLQHALALGMSPCEVIEVEVFPRWHGDVFNLSTTGRWYTADGIACHNCRCTMLFPLPDSPTGEVLQWKAFNPWQPRHPMGSGRGGQWVDQDDLPTAAQAPLFQAPGQSVGTAPARSKPAGPAPRGLAAYGTGAKPRGRVIVRDVGPGQAPRSPSGNFAVGGTSRSGAPPPGSLKNPAGLTRPTVSSPPPARDWPGFPEARGDEGSPGPSGDFDADVARIERLQSRYMRAGQETTVLYASKSGRRRYSRDRERQHEEIIDHFVNAAGVRADGRALLLGGLPGAGKTTSLNDPSVQALIDVDLSEYVTANSDEVKAEMIRRGMVPDYPGLTPLESATMYQKESHEVFQRILDRAFSQRKNVAVDMTLRNPGHWDVTRSQMRAGEPPRYERTLLFVDVPVDTALDRAQSRYEAGDRYVPAGFISGLRGRGGKTAPREVFDQVKNRADRWLLVDNSGAGPQLVADGGRF